MSSTCIRCSSPITHRGYCDPHYWECIDLLKAELRLLGLRAQDLGIYASFTLDGASLSPHPAPDPLKAPAPAPASTPVHLHLAPEGASLDQLVKAHADALRHAERLGQYMSSGEWRQPRFDTAFNLRLNYRSSREIWQNAIQLARLVATQIREEAVVLLEAHLADLRRFSTQP